MASENKPFDELLNEAPLAAREETISLIGAVQRSHEPGKFVLILSAGNSVTIDIDAVQAHRVLGGMVGQLLVEVDLDRNKVPRALTTMRAEFKSPLLDWAKLFPQMNHKNPILDTHPGIVPDVSVPYLAPPVSGPVPVPPGGDPWSSFGAGQMIAPFALATPHHAPANMIAASQYSPFTFPWLAVKPPVTDRKLPFQDGTIGHHLDF